MTDWKLNTQCDIFVLFYEKHGRRIDKSYDVKNKVGECKALLEKNLLISSLFGLIHKGVSSLNKFLKIFDMFVKQ